MKKTRVLLYIIASSFLICSPAFAGGMSSDELLEELKELRRNQEELNKRIDRLEKELKTKEKEIETLKNQGVSQEEAVDESQFEGLKKWSDRIELSGAVEVEFSNLHSEFKDNTDPDLPHDKVQEHDLTLSTVELGLDARINKYTTAHILFLYEEDEDADRVRLDEGFIEIGGIPETYGLYARAGKYYPHFGELNTYLVSDPITLEIFEIRETAAEAGWQSEWISAGAGIFNGDVQKDFHSENNRINGMFADVNFHNPEDKLGGVSLLTGLSYLSSIADSDTLEGEVLDLNGDGDVNDLDSWVDGIAGYLVAEYGMFSFGAEYITAVDDFEAGEMAYAFSRDGRARRSRPAAWNVEAAVRPLEYLQLAGRYEGSRDMFDLFPEDQFAFAISWEIWDYFTLSGEYAHGDYEDSTAAVDRDQDVFTFQAAVGF